MGFLPVDDQLEIISKGTEEVIPLQDLRHKLEFSIKKDKPLVIKLGCDPSSSKVKRFSRFRTPSYTCDW